MSVQGNTAIVISWVASNSTETLRTYVVEASSNGPNGGFVRVNKVDVIATAWLHRWRAAGGANSPPASILCYRVQAIDYWGRASMPSDAVCQ